MKLLFVALAFLAGAPSGEGTAAVISVNPIQKVLEMISGLQAKIIEEGHSSQKIYADFAEMCEDRSTQLHFDIKTEKANIADLKAAIEDRVAKIAVLGSKIEDLAGSISEDEAELKKATHIRDGDAADFAASEKELMEVISTIQRASAILEREMQKGASFAQLKGAQGVATALAALVQSSAVNAADADRLTSLVQSATSSDDEDDSPDAPDAAAYENQSDGILDVLEGLLSKAEDELATLRKVEAQNKHNFEMKKQALEDEIRFAQKDMGAAKKNLADNKEKKAVAEGEMAASNKDLAADTASLGELHHDCMSKAAIYEEETKSRGEELNALATAKKIIAESTGGAESQTYGLNQVSLLQVASNEGLATSQALAILRRLAFERKSALMSQLASRVDATLHLAAAHKADPFAKVKGLITDMVQRLLKEAEADATQKAFCDKAMKETTEKKEDKTAELDKLKTKIEQMSAQSAKLKTEVNTLQKELSALSEEQAQMDKLRQQEHAVYAADKPAMEQGLEGIKKALEVLKDYYAQEDDAHDSADGAASGIIGILEVAEADFSKGIAELEAKEQKDARAYDEETKKNEVLIATKEQDRKFKTKEAAALDKSASELAADSNGVTAELNAVLEYEKELESECVAKPESYEERKAAREAEMAGLKQALETLEGEAAPSFVQPRNRALRASLAPESA